MRKRIVLSALIVAMLFFQVACIKSRGVITSGIKDSEEDGFDIYVDVAGESMPVTPSTDMNSPALGIAIEYPINNQSNSTTDNPIYADCIDCEQYNPPAPPTDPVNPIPPASDPEDDEQDNSGNELQDSDGEDNFDNDENEQISNIITYQWNAPLFIDDSIETNYDAPEKHLTHTIDENTSKSSEKSSKNLGNSSQIVRNKSDEKTGEEFTYYLVVIGIIPLLMLAIWFLTRKDEDIDEKFENPPTTKHVSAVNADTVCYPGTPRVVYGILNRKETDQ